MNYPLPPAQLEALAAWWRIGSVTGAAKDLGLAVQTVKNQLVSARRRSGATTTLDAVKANWRALAHLYPDDYRRLRYQFDLAYRERMRILHKHRAGGRPRKIREAGESAA